MERLELRDRDEDDDRLLAALDVDLAGSRDLEGRSSALRSGTLFSRSRSAWATRVSVASGAVRGALAVRKICLWCL